MTGFGKRSSLWCPYNTYKSSNSSWQSESGMKITRWKSTMRIVSKILATSGTWNRAKMLVYPWGRTNPNNWNIIDHWISAKTIDCFMTSINWQIIALHTTSAIKVLDLIPICGIPTAPSPSTKWKRKNGKPKFYLWMEYYPPMLPSHKAINLSLSAGELL